MCQVAAVTGIDPNAIRNLDDSTLATLLDVLREQAEGR